MAQKKITELQLRSSVTADLNFPSDDGIQSYRVTGQQVKDYVLADGNVTAAKLATDAVETAKIKDLNVTTPKIAAEAVTLAKLAAEVLASFIPVGMISPFAGSSAPTGFLLCDGSAVSRSTYSALFSLIGTNYGSGDGSTTFNLPDLRWAFVRGRGADLTATGSGTASSNNGTFTAHGFNRSGIKVRLTSGTLSGLSTNTDYWTIYVDANTLAFASSRANALSGTKVAISGANSAVIAQKEDPSAASRVALQSGGNTGASVGSYQADAFQGHYHTTNKVFPSGCGGTGGTPMRSDGSTVANDWIQAAVTDTTSGTPRTDLETRPSNVSLNYIIKT